MDCRSCGVVNAPGRRYCRECGARLGQPCPVCHFFNAVEDKHCGGCGRRLKAGAGPLATEAPPVSAFAAPPGGAEFGGIENEVPPPVADPGVGGPGVSQSEIDGLFESILDDEPADQEEGGT